MFSDFVAVPFEEDWSKFINKLNKKSKSNSELKKKINYLFLYQDYCFKE